MGGTFNKTGGKRRPGIYFNFVAAALARIQAGERGTVALPLSLPWGDPKTFLVIEEEGQVYEKLGYDINDAPMLPVREAFKMAKTVLVYRMNTGSKASGTVGTLTATAKHGGARGNDVSFQIVTNVLDSSKMDVVTLLANRVVDEQQGVTTVADLMANDWIVWSGTGDLEATAGTTLTGGADGTLINQDYTEFLGATETQQMDTIAYPVTDPTLQQSFVTFIRRMRDDEGKKIVGVAPNISADYEGIISVKNGVILEDGTVLEAKDVVPWVAGASAGASITQSLTYTEYAGAADANPRFRNSEIIAALEAGEFLFVHDGDKVKVEQDINSLVTYGQDKNERFSKNRVIRVLDGINNDITKAFRDNYIGKVDNHADGQALLTDAVLQYLQTLADAGAIQNFNPRIDFVIDPVKSVGDEVWATIGVQPVDSMEKFYFTVKVV